MANRLQDSDAGHGALRDMLALEQEASDLDGTRFLTVLRRRWKVAVAIPILFTVAGYFWAQRQTEQFDASASVILRASVTETLFGTVDTAKDPDRDLRTEAELMTSGSFRDAVDAKLGRTAVYDVAPIAGTDVLSIKGHGSRASDAAGTANAVADYYVAQRRDRLLQDLTLARNTLTSKIAEVQPQLDKVNLDLAQPGAAGDQVLLARRLLVTDQLAGYRDKLSGLDIEAAVTTGGARVVAPAAIPGGPVAPRPRRTAAMFFFLGLFVGIVAAQLVDRLADGLDDVDEFEKRLGGVRILANVPNLGSPHRGVMLLGAPQSAAAEAIRSLRTSLQFLALDHKIRRIQVTSSAEDEGATATAANLAVAFAGAGMRVVLVDGDLRQPQLHQYFGLDGSRGFTTVLVGQSPLDSVLQPVAMQGWLRVLPAGPRPSNPAELLASGHLSRLLDELEQRCDIVIIDTPPVLPYTDAAVTAGHVDATVLVASMRSSRLKVIQRALRTLRVVDANVAGVVISQLEEPRSERSEQRNTPAQSAGA